ncbi:uncharacterized protein LOC142627137 [Castanea sativa]|uniref:uncharacterized protein LOC142627137 n=1 Tax=Castanea sativa TaxID=21020 RepID=UPI003F65006D
MEIATNIEDLAVIVSVGAATGNSVRSDRSDSMATLVQIFEDNEAEKPSNATAEPSTWAELGISHADHAIPSLLRESVEALLARLDEDVGCDCPASHFFKFTSSETSIQRFSILSESAPILEQLRSKHEDFVGQLEVG